MEILNREGSNQAEEHEVTGEELFNSRTVEEYLLLILKKYFNK